MAEIRVGISGWTYPPWRGKFYPPALTHKLELAYASRRFNALEINGTFYSLQKPSNFQSWYEQTPHDFVFALKGGKYITHQRKLRDPEQPLANFLASGILRLREKLGPILWQFPPQLSFDEARFEAFFKLLPHDTEQVARLGSKHGDYVRGRAELHPDELRPVRHAVEFRHESFMSERFVELLRAYDIALVIADVASKYPTAEDVTADWVYVRLHGSRQLYSSGYTPREIDAWASKVKAWHAGKELPDARKISSRSPPTKTRRDVFVFFDNTDVKLRAPVDARRMAGVLDIGPSQTPQQVLRELGLQPKPAAPSKRKSSRKS